MGTQADMHFIVPVVNFLHRALGGCRVHRVVTPGSGCPAKVKYKDLWWVKVGGGGGVCKKCHIISLHKQRAGENSTASHYWGVVLVLAPSGVWAVGSIRRGRVAMQSGVKAHFSHVISHALRGLSTSNSGSPVMFCLGGVVLKHRSSSALIQERCGTCREWGWKCSLAVPMMGILWTYCHQCAATPLVWQ